MPCAGSYEGTTLNRPHGFGQPEFGWWAALTGREAALRRPRPVGAERMCEQVVFYNVRFRHLTLRSAPWTAQRAIPTLKRNVAHHREPELLPPRRRCARLRSPMAISVSIVEDNAGIRKSFSALLDRTPGMRCAGAYGTAEEAIVGMPAAGSDVALVDIHLPGMNGIDCVRRLKELLPALQILMLTRYEQSDFIFNSIRAGASGYLLKNTPPDNLVRAIEQVHAGG